MESSAKENAFITQDDAPLFKSVNYERDLSSTEEQIVTSVSEEEPSTPSSISSRNSTSRSEAPAPGGNNERRRGPVVTLKNSSDSSSVFSSDSWPVMVSVELDTSESDNSPGSQEDSPVFKNDIMTYDGVPVMCKRMSLEDITTILSQRKGVSEKMKLAIEGIVHHPWASDTGGAASDPDGNLVPRPHVLVDGQAHGYVSQTLSRRSSTGEEYLSPTTPQLKQVLLDQKNKLQQRRKQLQLMHAHQRQQQQFFSLRYLSDDRDTGSPDVFTSNSSPSIYTYDTVVPGMIDLHKSVETSTSQSSILSQPDLPLGTTTKKPNLILAVGPTAIKQVVHQLNHKKHCMVTDKMDIEDAPRSYLHIAIFSCCCCLSPLGLLAIIMAVLSGMSFKAGKREEASVYSKAALILALLAITTSMGIAIILIVITLYPSLHPG